MLSISVAVPCAWQMAGPRRATADRRVLPVRASEADAALWTLGLAAAAYFTQAAAVSCAAHLCLALGALAPVAAPEDPAAA